MSAPARSAVTAAELLPLAEAALPRYLADLAELVAVDSGSYSPHGVNRVADLLVTRLHGLGFTIERTRPDPEQGPPVGDVLVARRAGGLTAAAGGRRILLAGHMDTVFEDGTAAERPFSMVGAIAHGPGVSDDKGGLLAGLTAVDILLSAGWEDFGEILLLATPDEEIGSPASRPVTERVAAEADYALALECARENGDLVIERKGVADFQLTVTGRAAHAGIEPERGANAALAAAHHVVALQDLNGCWDGVTVNVGVVRAGTRANIVCPEAELRVEVRATTTEGLHLAADAVRALAAREVVAGTTTTVTRVDLCPPMEDTAAARAMYAVARGAAADLGVAFGAAATGGVGDANLIAGMGVPTLDGLGPVGGADHTPQEWLDTSSVPARVAILAATVAELGRRL
ncbi:M20/M25/M40 family metallo-hydrolase [Kitasatospora sp. NPDC057015]|uniref:M20/M25/M40 family metallo-hydrolase n=1 Tax=Kitasatospora sp. NPDC057015 TaxID=3346001 RepID=UPI00363B231E